MTLVSREQLLAVLAAFNPWWGSRSAPVPPFRRIAFGECARLLGEQRLRRAILLSGPRRVGKTTLLLQLAQREIERGRKPQGILYLSLDHPLIKLVRLSDVLRLYNDSVHAEGEPTLLLLDEVQYAEDWELEIKQIVDHRRECRIVATGSATVLQKKQLAESGVGRWVTVPVPTLSFYEFTRIRNDEARDVPASMAPIHLFSMRAADRLAVAAAFRPLLPAFARYLLVGGFPETARIDDVTLCQRLLREDVVERVLKRDMTSLFGVRNVNDLEKLFIYVCLHSGGIFQVQTCAKELGVSAITVANHIELLEQANLIYRVAPLSSGGKAVLKARHKVYLVDAALRNAVLLRGNEILSDPTEMGTVVETTILRHFKAFHHREAPKLGYWRGGAGDAEVDLIVQTPADKIPIEVKYREDGSLPPKAGILEYCRSEGATRGYWVTKRDTDFAVSRQGKTPIAIVPAHILTYLLGQAEQAMWSGSALD